MAGATQDVASEVSQRPLISKTDPRNTKYVATWPDELSPRALWARFILNEPLVFFRKEEGSMSALAGRRVL